LARSEGAAIIRTMNNSWSTIVAHEFSIMYVKGDLVWRELNDSIMPRRRKRKRVPLEEEPLSDYGTTRDGDTDNGTPRDNDITRDDGGPPNPTGGGKDGRTGNTTRTADSGDSSRATGYGAGGTSRGSGSAGTDRVFTALEYIHQPF